MMAKSFLEVIQQEVFRKDLQKLILTSGVKNYANDLPLPPLYKYNRLSSYLIDDIENKCISLSPISSFNDYFDSAIHTPVANDAGWKEATNLNAMFQGLMQTPMPGNIDQLAQTMQDNYERQERSRFSFLPSFLGICVRSLSTNSKSTLMWAHYADMNQGICIEYKYDKLPTNHLLRYMLFPVAYINHPIDMSAYFDYKNRICEYPAEVSVYASALCKAECWAYEQEWRIVYLNEFGDRRKQEYIKFNGIIAPSTITLGYHFLKPLFVKDRLTDHKGLLLRVINYVEKENIPLCMTVPNVGDFKQQIIEVSPQILRSFILRNFHDDYVENIYYYDTIQDRLLEELKARKYINI